MGEKMFHNMPKNIVATGHVNATTGRRCSLRPVGCVWGGGYPIT